VDELQGREHTPSLEATARSVVEHLASLGPVAVELVGPGRSRRSLAGSWPTAAPVTARATCPATGRTLELVAPDAPPATVGLAVDLLQSALDRQAAIEEQQRVERTARSAAARFEALVAAAPDAIIVVARDGRITAVNPQAAAVFGYAVDDLVGRPVDDLLPDAMRAHHVSLRESYHRDARPRPMGAGRDLEARRADGTLVPVDIGLTPIDVGGELAVAAFVRDATARRDAELHRRRFAEVQLRRRQALELNDTVVQGLVALLWRLDDGEASEARRIAETTLAAARRIMADLLRDDLDELPADGLVRSEHARIGPLPSAPPPPSTPPSTVGAPDHHRSVLIADDAPDLRFLLRHRLDRAEDVHVVAEAADGQQAIELALHHRPDVVLLDLSMPVLDGLEAARRIRASLPGTRIVVLSGYPDEVMRQRALEAGADQYCEKTATLEEVEHAVTDPHHHG
jgi:PAS domain S-box-containing protein